MAVEKIQTRKLDNMTIGTTATVLGIDISKLTFDVTLLTGLAGVGKHAQFSNDKRGFKELKKWLKQQQIVFSALLTAMEATGSHWRKLARFLFDLGSAVFVVNPARIRGYFKSEHKRSKNDKIDSGVIARFCKAQIDLLHRWEPPHQDVEELQSLTRLRDSLVSNRAAYKNQLKSGAFNSAAKSSIRRMIDACNNEIRQLEKLIKDVIQQNEELKNQFQLAIAIKGIGKVVAATAIAETRAFKEFLEAKQVAAFAGLDVVEFSSGTSIKAKPHISKKGNTRLRAAMYMAAQSAVRRNPVIKPFYERLLNKGLTKRQAIVASARKLLEICFAVVKSGRPFDINYRRNLALAV
jgi:transposase